MSYNFEYNEYIKSERWYETRQEAFKVHGKYCHRCGAKQYLHVHHKTYKRFKNENVAIDLIPLCNTCHELCHNFCESEGYDLFHGTEKFLSLEKKYKKQKKPKRDKKFKKRRWTEKFKPWEVRPSAVKANKDEKENNIVRAKGKNQPTNVNVQAFMKMYSIDEVTARSILKI